MGFCCGGGVGVGAEKMLGGGEGLTERAGWWGGGIGSGI